MQVYPGPLQKQLAYLFVCIAISDFSCMSSFVSGSYHQPQRLYQCVPCSHRQYKKTRKKRKIRYEIKKPREKSQSTLTLSKDTLLDSPSNSSSLQGILHHPRQPLSAQQSLDRSTGRSDTLPDFPFFPVVRVLVFHPPFLLAFPPLVFWSPRFPFSDNFFHIIRTPTVQAMQSLGPCSP